MPTASFASAVLVAAFLTVPALTSAQEKVPAQPIEGPQLITQAANKEATPEQTRQPVTKVVYVPPLRGAPALRVVAATRGKGSRVFLATLAPDHAGWTTSPQPTLYWYVSEAVDEIVEVIIADDEHIDPLLEVRLNGPLESGIQSFDLKEQGIALTEGTEYVWSVSIVHDTEQRSKDTFAEGAITKVEPSESLKVSLAGAGPDERPRLLAEAGFWYDAVDEISRRIVEDSPDGDRWRRERVTLLEQVGIGALAAEGVRLD